MAEHEIIEQATKRANKLRDIVAEEIVGVQIGSLGHRLWICVDGQAVLRVKSPVIEFSDLRITSENSEDSSNSEDGTVDRLKEASLGLLEQLASLSDPNFVDQCDRYAVAGVCQNALDVLKNLLDILNH